MELLEAYLDGGRLLAVLWPSLIRYVWRKCSLNWTSILKVFLSWVLPILNRSSTFLGLFEGALGKPRVCLNFFELVITNHRGVSFADNLWAILSNGSKPRRHQRNPLHRKCSCEVCHQSTSTIEKQVWSLAYCLLHQAFFRRFSRNWRFFLN